MASRNQQPTNPPLPPAHQYMAATKLSNKGHKRSCTAVCLSGRPTRRGSGHKASSSEVTPKEKSSQQSQEVSQRRSPGARPAKGAKSSTKKGTWGVREKNSQKDAVGLEGKDTPFIGKSKLYSRSRSKHKNGSKAKLKQLTDTSQCSSHDSELQKNKSDAVVSHNGSRTITGGDRDMLPSRDSPKTSFQGCNKLTSGTTVHSSHSILSNASVNLPIKASTSCPSPDEDVPKPSDDVWYNSEEGPGFGYQSEEPVNTWPSQWSHSDSGILPPQGTSNRVHSHSSGRYLQQQGNHKIKFLVVICSTLKQLTHQKVTTTLDFNMKMFTHIKFQSQDILRRWTDTSDSEGVATPPSAPPLDTLCEEDFSLHHTGLVDMHGVVYEARPPDQTTDQNQVDVCQGQYVATGQTQHVDERISQIQKQLDTIYQKMDQFQDRYQSVATMDQSRDKEDVGCTADGGVGKIPVNRSSSTHWHEAYDFDFDEEVMNRATQYSLSEGGSDLVTARVIPGSSGLCGDWASQIMADIEAKLRLDCVNKMLQSCTEDVSEKPAGVQSYAGKSGISPEPYPSAHASAGFISASIPASGSAAASAQYGHYSAGMSGPPCWSSSHMPQAPMPQVDHEEAAVPSVVPLWQEQTMTNAPSAFMPPGLDARVSKFTESTPDDVGHTTASVHPQFVDISPSLSPLPSPKLNDIDANMTSIDIVREPYIGIFDPTNQEKVCTNQE
ncbi:hypothetical protein LSAT2_030843 [Lamellibrachia satsuma]|nr:hypothetical protein LSAT2_030843 [Lamellibrachia satsuma]